MIKLIFTVMALVLIAVVANFVYSEGQPSRWKYYSTDGAHNDHYYDTKSIVHTKNNIVRVWEKKVATEKSDEIMKTIKEFAELKEINCPLREYRSHVNYYYQSEEKWQRKPTDWEAIEPETWMETLYDIVCKKGKN
jgi:hypothetical protein